MPVDYDKLHRFDRRIDSDRIRIKDDDDRKTMDEVISVPANHRHQTMTSVPIRKRDSGNAAGIRCW